MYFGGNLAMCGELYVDRFCATDCVCSVRILLFDNCSVSLYNVFFFIYSSMIYSVFELILIKQCKAIRRILSVVRYFLLHDFFNNNSRQIIDSHYRFKIASLQISRQQLLEQLNNCTRLLNDTRLSQTQNNNCFNNILLYYLYQN